jgi:hypothetical protein
VFSQGFVCVVCLYALYGKCSSKQRKASGGELRTDVADLLALFLIQSADAMQAHFCVQWRLSRRGALGQQQKWVFVECVCAEDAKPCGGLRKCIPRFLQGRGALLMPSQLSFPLADVGRHC